MRSFTFKGVASYIVSLLLALVVFGNANAQIIPGITPSSSNTEAAHFDAPETKAAVREMVATLSDNQVRQLLIERMDAVAQKSSDKLAEGQTLFEILRNGFAKYFAYAKQSALNISSIPQIIADISAQINASYKHGGTAWLWLMILCAIVVGLLAERFVAYLFRRPKQRLIESSSATLWGILRIIYTRLSMDVLGVVAFFLASYLTISIIFDYKSYANHYAYTVLACLFAAGLGLVVARFYFAPQRADLRICNTTDQRAMRLTLSYGFIAGYIVLVHNIFFLFVRISQEQLDSWNYASPLFYFMHIAQYAGAILVIWYNRAGLTEILSNNRRRVYASIGEEAGDDETWFARNWPTIAMVLIVLQYLLVELIVNLSDALVYSTAAVYISFVMIFLWPCTDAVITLFVSKGIQKPEDESAAASKARRKMQRGLLRVGRVLVLSLLAYIQAWLWGVNFFDLAQAGLGAQAASNLIELILIILMAYVVWEVLSIYIDHRIAQETGGDEEEEGGGEIGGVGLSRTATLLPIVRRTLQFIIVVVSIIIVLDKWGINIAPIIAGAGVVGLAIGFGAQTLVKDIVSGLFFLTDDAFRVGEYIDVGGTMGNVEKISLRSLRLRHHRGLVHTIPYGEIPKLTNYSRDWVIMKLPFRVPFDTDINKVKKIFKTIGAELLEDPVLGEDFLQPFKSQGVAEVDDNGFVVRGKFMSKPGKQFMIRKEVYVRVQKAFDEAGIPFARKQVMVHIPGLEKGDELSKDDLQKVAAAAADAAEEPVVTPPPKTS